MHIVIAEPVTLAVNIERVKDQLELDSEYRDRDTLLTTYIKSNTRKLENYLNRIIPVTDVQIRVKPKGKDSIVIPTPCIEILEVKSCTTGIESSDLKGNFDIYKYTEPNRLILKSNNEWNNEVDYYEIKLRCGYETVPDNFQDYLLIKVADQYENRTQQVRDRMNNADDLVCMDRIYDFNIELPKILTDSDV